MTEKLLQFIWRFRYFNHSQLSSAAGEVIQVFNPGLLNRNQGPDFTNATVVVDGSRREGQVELHLRTSDWNRHHHDSDPNYGAVILHVVWIHDRLVNEVPVLELQDRVPGQLLTHYRGLMGNVSFIPCNADISQLTSLAWESWKDRLLFERVARKIARVAYNDKAVAIGPESHWWMLARSFGNRVNATAFEMLARSIPLQAIWRIKHSLFRLEALLMGQAGLLNDPVDEYHALLAAEYRVLRNRFKLEPVGQPFLFLRMRPSGFPGIRLAQLAALLCSHAEPGRQAKDTGSLKEMEILLRVKVSSYWQQHYRAGRQTKRNCGHLGKWMVSNLVINAFVPMLFSETDRSGDSCFAEKATGWLQQLGRERNAITDTLHLLGMQQHNAFDSQAMLELKGQYCDERRCLECAVGYSLLHPRNSPGTGSIRTSYPS